MSNERLSNQAKQLIEEIFSNPFNDGARAALTDKLEEDGVGVEEAFPKV